MPDEEAKPAAAEPTEEAAPAAPPLLVTTSPHVLSAENIPRIMWTVSATLMPAFAWAVYAFGPRALLTTGIAVASAVATEAIWQKLRGRPVTVSDGSAFLSGLLVAFVFPSHAPWYVPLTASIFAMAIVKQLFGGLGCNVWNPALMGRAFVLACGTWGMAANAFWPTAFGYLKPARDKAAAATAQEVDATTGATPLSKLKDGLRDFKGEVAKQAREFKDGRRKTVLAPHNAREAREALREFREAHGTPLDDLYFGRTGGCIGEVNACFLFLGGIVLVFLNYIKWQVPVLFIGTVALLSWMLPVNVPGVNAAGDATSYALWFAGEPLAEVFAGGLFLGAFYMATDMVTSPVTTKGQAVFAIGCALFTVLIRRYGGYPEGVCYAILLMNTATPIINRYTRMKVFGQREKK
ncbi:MAG: RnfABCDGE type electron transport complex subunit D [Planctomycetes bacterium]|nr:RnfABCDGE type electron transport complex subunit D [Planctomycetota bacterium]